LQDKARKVVNNKDIFLLIAISFLVFVFDQFTKVIIRQNLSNGEIISIIDGFVQIKGVDNPGGAFGFFPGSKIFLLTVSIVVVIIAVIYWQMNRPNERVLTISFGLIIGGALGNMLDRFLFSNVTDFIDFRYWPVFNIADLSIVLGMIFFLNSCLKNEGDHRERE